MIATRSVVEAELGRALRSRHSNKRNSVLLLRAAPEWRGDREFSVTVEDGQVPVTVAPCATVLAVLDAMGAAREDGRYLVVLTPCDSRDVGDSVLSRAMQPEIKPINRWDLVADAFGARGLDPALTKSDRRWVAEALLDAQPPGGWRRLAGPVLTEATALNRLAATRLGIEDADGSAVDAAALLQWTTHPAAVASFLQLRETERDGLIQWLNQTAAPVAGIVFAMAGPGKHHQRRPVRTRHRGPVLRRTPRARYPHGADPRRGTIPWRALARSGGAGRVRRGRRVAGRKVDGQRTRSAGGRTVRARRGHPQRPGGQPGDGAGLGRTQPGAGSRARCTARRAQ